MDDNQFDKLVQRLTSAPSRREAVAGLVAGTLTSVGLTSVADAKRRNKKNQRDRNGGKGNGKNRRGGNDHGRGRDNVEDEKKNHNHKHKHKRCRKVGRGCSKNKKCCSKFCDSNTGLCARKPDS